MGVLMTDLATSLTVSVAVQKYAGDSFHPICSNFGMKSCILAEVDSRIYANAYSVPSFVVH